MTQYLTPALEAMLSHQITPFFWHTYTRIPRVPATGTDDWGEPVWVDGTPVPGQPCLFMDHGDSAILPNGLVEINMPVIMVPKPDPLTEGDKVSNVQARDGTVLLDSPTLVEHGSNVAYQSGGALYNVLSLRKPEEV